MPDSNIWIVNRSTLVSNADAATMTAAISKQVAGDAAPAWGLPAPAVTFTTGAPPKGARVIVLVDTCDDPQALGYHTETLGAVQSGFVGCKPELDAGYKILTGPYSVASILSHEVLEMLVDGHCNLFADSGHGYLVAFEVCDPVQSDWYVIDGVSVSNFVTPAWFDALSPRGVATDHLGRLTQPFKLSRGGYWVQLTEGRASQKFGEDMPEWLRATKRHGLTRTSRLSHGCDAAAPTLP